MISALLRVALRRAPSRVRHVEPVARDMATGLVADVYAQVERDFGLLAPPISLHSPSPEVMAASWLLLRETLLVDGAVDRGWKEAVAAAVSEANSCPYCVEVHGATARGLGRNGDHDLASLFAGDISSDHSAELIGVAATFEYLNRMVNVFLPVSPLPPGASPAVSARANRVLGRLLLPRRAVLPQQSAITESPPSWAATGHVGAAFTRARTAFDAAGERSVPAPVREVVTAVLADWNGEPPGLSRSWVDRPVSALNEKQRPAARLALLTAMASYQVDDTVIGELRHQGTDDAELIDMTAWASFVAASCRAEQFQRLFGGNTRR